MLACPAKLSSLLLPLPVNGQRIKKQGGEIHDPASYQHEI